MRQQKSYNTRILALVLVASLTLPNGTVGQKDSFGKELGREVAMDVAKNAAMTLAPMFLHELGVNSPLVDAFFGISAGTPPINYERITGIVSDVVYEADLKRAVGESQSLIDRKDDALLEEVRKYRDAKAKDAMGSSSETQIVKSDTIRNIGDSLRELEGAIDKLAPLETRNSIYLWTVAQNLRLGTAVVLTGEGGSSWSPGYLLKEVKSARAHLHPNARIDTRIDMLECQGSRVVDSHDNDKNGQSSTVLSWGKKNCESFLRQVKWSFTAAATPWYGPGFDKSYCDCSNWYTWKEESLGTTCEGNSWQLYIGTGDQPQNRIDGSQPRKERCHELRAIYVRRARAIYKDAIQRRDYLKSFDKSWFALETKLELAVMDPAPAGCIKLFENVQANRRVAQLCAGHAIPKVASWSGAYTSFKCDGQMASFRFEDESDGRVGECKCSGVGGGAVAEACDSVIGREGEIRQGLTLYTTKW